MTMLRIECWPVPAITKAEKHRMYELMDEYYANVAWNEFRDDLANKQWVLVLRSLNASLVGFSTQKIFDFHFEGNIYRIVFSGDTIIDKMYRGTQELAWGFGRFMLDIQQQCPAQPLYWLLTSKGVRTYRYLPLYFQDFFPRFDQPTPSRVGRLMDGLGAYLFASRYDNGRRLLLASEGGQCLREFDIPDRDSANPHFRYFIERNPNHRKGEELVCLAEFSRDNLNKRAWHAIQARASLLPKFGDPTEQHGVPDQTIAKSDSSIHMQSCS
jgi:hypothetical protein